MKIVDLVEPNWVMMEDAGRDQASLGHYETKVSRFWALNSALSS